jgi:hypothetical protein
LLAVVTHVYPGLDLIFNNLAGRSFYFCGKGFRIYRLAPVLGGQQADQGIASGQAARVSSENTSIAAPHKHLPLYN